ncbi:MAG: hypothetical protein ACKVU0_05400, partial [Saprospiraceae bacterium]
PFRLAEKHSESLKSLKLLFFDAGKHDEFALDLGARILSKRLKELNINHIYEEFDDGHFNIKSGLRRWLWLVAQYHALNLPTHIQRKRIATFVSRLRLAAPVFFQPISSESGLRPCLQ